jgi:hypothetical protein
MNIGDTMSYQGQPGTKPVLVVVLSVGNLITVRFPSGEIRSVAPWRLTKPSNPTPS